MSDKRNLRQGVRNVSATEAAKNFGSILTEVRERGTEYVVEHRGKPVARISPEENRRLTLREFAEIVRNRTIPSPGEEYLRAVEEGIAYFNRPEVPADPWER
ncbi:type II toxin-antitoxin system Phd/YefM family antitoxin [Candidatus Palauibacter sp.]|uniref:type II toxin-antitoxin system Phd/YefM family antitoxin n=1 Tax=Candidatus Palauibacter sp. TaxID=3101350 RepID=UPI003B01C672